MARDSNAGFVNSLLLLLATTCGSNAADAVRPKSVTASVALGETNLGKDGNCLDVIDGGRPLVVDWRPEQRGDLEVVMSRALPS